MKKGKTEKRIKALGWKDGTVAEFLGLTPQESALIEIKLGRLASRDSSETTERETNGGKNQRGLPTPRRETVTGRGAAIKQRSFSKTRRTA